MNIVIIVGDNVKRCYIIILFRSWSEYANAELNAHHLYLSAMCEDAQGDRAPTIRHLNR